MALTIMAVIVKQITETVAVMLATFVRRYGVQTVAVSVWAATLLIVVR